MKKKSNDSSVAIAKLTTIQAIVVALITAVAGVTTGYIVRGPNTLADEEIASQRWITIRNIESEDHTLIRLVIQVNGVKFSYPSNAVWAEIGEGKSQERFPLPISDSGYRVSFRAFLSDPGNVPTSIVDSQDTHEYSSSNLPANNVTYKIYPHSASGSYAAASSTVQVDYSIE